MSYCESQSFFFSPGSYDASVRIWDCRTRVHDPVQVLGEAKDSVTSLSVAASEILTGLVDVQYKRIKILN